MNDRFKFRAWNTIVERFQYFDFKELSNMEYKDIQWHILEFQQSTGLKDKNGKLIYEGDILGGSYGNLYIHYCDKCKQFQLKVKDYGCLACEGDVHWYEVVESEDENELEVIGNIYENKELLEEECQK